MNMNAPIHEDDEQEKPLDPSVERVRQKIVRFMIINLAVLAAALIVVIGAIVYKSRNNAPAQIAAQPGVAAPADGGHIEGTIALPAGARIVSQALSGDRVSLQVETPDGGRALYVYDVVNARLVGRFAIQNETR